MREHKSRAWDKTNKKMIYGIMATCSDEGGWILFTAECEGVDCSKAIHDIRQYEVMDYIGRKDINDKEIYEGDVVDYLDNTSSGLMKKTVVVKDIRHFPDFGCSKWEEIIGNLYESPELAAEVPPS